MLFQLNEGFCLVNEQQKVQISLPTRRGARSANLKEKSPAKTETHKLLRPSRSFKVLAKQIFAKKLMKTFANLPEFKWGQSKFEITAMRVPLCEISE